MDAYWSNLGHLSRAIEASTAERLQDYKCAQNYEGVELFFSFLLTRQYGCIMPAENHIPE
jgi:hypothetical protein